MKPKAFLHISAFVVLVAPRALLACDESSAVKEPVVDASVPTSPTTPPTNPLADGGTEDAGPRDCVENPKTHAEIINACTNAVKITKNPVLPKLLPDGGLPPLP